jgi:hypothetical protein
MTKRKQRRNIPMASIAQKELFGWQEIKKLGDLERLDLVIKNIPDQELIKKLEKQRGRGRDDYPVRAIWNSILAGVVYEHESISSLIRELKRNGQLRQICGFDIYKGIKAVPSQFAYTRFLKKLIKHGQEINKMFKILVEEIKKELPDFGEILAIDGKAIQSHARGKRKKNDMTQDGRRDVDADWGKKVYKGQREDGTLWEKVKSWFGYKMHLVVDAKYELPVSYEVTKASVSEMPMAHQLLGKIKEEHKDIVERCKYWLGDRGLDDGKMIKRLWDEYKIKPVIDIRNTWKDAEDTKVVNGYWNVLYNYKGDVYCVCPASGDTKEMAYGGFEHSRETLKYRCPALHYGYECKGSNRCKIGKSIRIPLKEDRRIFTPLCRSSYRFKNIYKKRTAVERVNSRLDVSFGFERHFIRGLNKMKLRIGIALCVMLSMALGRIKEKQKHLMRSLVKCA